MKEILVKKINSSLWWHVPPQDRNAYKKRGKFLASSFRQAEFYGRPKDVPEKVSISNLLYGFSEMEIMKTLFPNEYKDLHKSVTNDDHDREWYKQRIELDAKIYKRARKMGYDAIALLTPNARKRLEKNRKPHSIELNLLSV